MKVLKAQFFPSCLPVKHRYRAVGSPQMLLGKPHIFQLICLVQGETDGLVAVLSLSPSVSRGHAGVLL